MTLRIVPCTIRRAKAYVAEHHRHHPRLTGALFAVAAAADGEIAGVAVVGRPVARALQDGETAEVTRLCTTGHRNACSKLYGAARRAAFELGYRRVYTYTLEGEDGASLRAAGFVRDGVTRGGQHDTPARRRRRTEQDGPKVRWLCMRGAA